MIQSRELSDAERQQHNNNMEMMRAEAAHVEKLKDLELRTKLAEVNGRLESAKASRESQERIKNDELALARLEAKWLSWLRIPLTIVKLPLYIILGVAACISISKHNDIPKSLENLLNK